MTSFEISEPYAQEAAVYAEETHGGSMTLKACRKLSVDETEALANYLSAWVAMQRAASQNKQPQLEFKVDYDYTQQPPKHWGYDTSNCPCRRENGGSGICNCTLNNLLYS